MASFMGSSSPGQYYAIFPDASPKDADLILFLFDRTWADSDPGRWKDIATEFNLTPSEVNAFDSSAGYIVIDKPKGKPVILVSVRDDSGPYRGDFLTARLVDIVMDNLKFLGQKKIWVGVSRHPETYVPLEWVYHTVLNAMDKLSEPAIKAGILFIIAIPEPPEPSYSGSNRIAGLLPDSEKGKDRLGILQDVSAFARVMAAKSFEPPLAIALFGSWGSGKSFFMRMLQKQITSLSSTSKDGYFCKGVVHIRFNAWSYLDANLWASIMTRIFEGLNEYIHKNIPAEALEKIGTQLNKQLNISKKEVASLEEQKNSIQGQITTLENRKTTLDDDIQNKIAEIKQHTAWQVVDEVNTQFKVKEQIKKTLEDNDSYVRSEAELKKIVPEKYWNDPNAAYREARSKATFLREFFRSKKFIGNLFWLALILALIFLVPVLLQIASDRLKTINFTLTQAGLSLLVAIGGIWKRAETTYKKLQPIAASFWKIKEDHEKKVQEALAQFEQREKALNLEIEKAKAELVVVEQQIHQNKAIQAQLKFKISNALSTEALYSFIEKRSKSDDYAKHLGLISVIRKDFEMLSYLFAGHQAELEDIKKAEELKKQFEANFTKPLERIILYIDDLDRCPEENVVQVLEAVNLLMAYPLFVVVVGVDLAWIRNALAKRHATQFTGTDAIDPARYLEKIIQVPFYLQEASDKQVKAMLSWLASWQFKFNPDEQEDDSKDRSGSDNRLPGSNSQQPGDRNQPSGESNQQPDGNKQEPAEEEIELHQIVAFIDDDEIDAMRALSRVVGANPRAIKRFVNSYRIVKCHEGFTYKQSEVIGILFLLALPIGPYRRLLPNFEGYIAEPINIERNFEEWLDSPFGQGPEQQAIGTLRDDLQLDLQGDLEDRPLYSRLAGTPVSVLQKHNDFISRFTFKDSR